MNCPYCAAPLADGARFCPACGKPIIATESSGDSMPAAPPERDLVGREIAGRYRVTKKLGEGGMGAVYKAEQISLKRQVAVKVLRSELSQNQQLLRRFDAEAQAVAKLNHPNIVGIYDNGQDTDGSVFIAMEFIEGKSLRSVVNREAPLHPARALNIASQVAAALSEAHAHAIVHRDLKPDNVMLQDNRRQKDLVRVLDFGIAKLRDDSRATQAAMTQAGDMLGTPQYMAPEQIKGEMVDGRTDIYALGCMIYEMVTGRQPFEATTVMAMLSKHLMETVVPPSQRRPELQVSPEIDRLVLSAMMKDPNARPPTMDVYGEQIAAVIATLPPDPNRSQSGIQPQPSAVQPAPTPPQQFLPTAATGQAAFTPPYAPNVVVAAPSQFPPSQLPTMMKRPQASKAPLWIALVCLLLGGGGAAAYFLTRPSTNSADQPPEKGSDTPVPKPPEPPKAPDPWANTKPGTDDNSAPAGRAPTPHASLPDGRVEPATQGVKIVVPRGFKISRAGGNLNASTVHYNIEAAPLVTAKTDPNDIAQEYADKFQLTNDGIEVAEYAGAKRVVARFHGLLSGIAVQQTIVSYTGSGYNVLVALTVPYGARNDAATTRFAQELFDKRVLLP